MKQKWYNRLLGRHVGEDHWARQYDDGTKLSRITRTTWKYPGFIRRFLRRIKLDRSVWTMKVLKVKQIEKRS